MHLKYQFKEWMSQKSASQPAGSQLLSIDMKTVAHYCVIVWQSEQTLQWYEDTVHQTSERITGIETTAGRPIDN